MNMESTSTFAIGGNINIYGNGTLANYGLISGIFQNFSIGSSFVNFGKVLINGTLLLINDSTNWGQFYILNILYYMYFY